MVGVSLLRFRGPYTNPVGEKSPLLGYRCKSCGYFERNPDIEIVEKGGFTKALRTKFTMAICATALIVINKTWLDNYHNLDRETLTQVGVSKKLKRPLILMIDQDITPPERKSIDRIFRKHKVIAKITFDPDNFDKCKPELGKALELYTKKYVKPRKRGAFR